MNLFRTFSCIVLHGLSKSSFKAELPLIIVLGDRIGCRTRLFNYFIFFCVIKLQNVLSEFYFFEV